MRPSATYSRSTDSSRIAHSPAPAGPGAALNMHFTRRHGGRSASAALRMRPTVSKEMLPNASSC